jgi:hypothetical protein
MKQINMLRSPFALLTLLLVCCSSSLFVQTSSAQTAPDLQLATRDAAAQQAAAAASGFDQVVDRAVEREHFFIAQMKQLHPLVETYLQNLKEDKDINAPVPSSDVYFLGRLDMSEGTDDRAFISPTTAGLGIRMLGKLKEAYSMKFLPLGFAQMVILDQDFQRKNYDFTFVRREFLGEVRCVVIDIAPKKNAPSGSFLGRIWVEDQDYNIVRFNGTYTQAHRNSYYLHFDTWRQNLRPGVWLPSLIYSEESDMKGHLGQALNYKAQTRLWGYNLKDLRRSSEFTEITVDSPQAVTDQSQKAQDASPIEAQRAWERQAENNVLDRLQQIGLLAPEGEVDKVLMTVVNNVMVTNNLDIQPEIRCRVLLTTPLHRPHNRGEPRHDRRAPRRSRFGHDSDPRTGAHRARSSPQYQARFQRPHVLPRRADLPAHGFRSR